MRVIILALCLTSACSAEVVDRVAASIGLRVITAAEVEQEARITSFDDGIPVDLTAANRRKVLDRLIDQFLIRKELELTRFMPVLDADIEPLLKQIRGRYSSEDQFNQALVNSGVTADDLKKHAGWTLTVLRFIEYRFQPAVQVSEVQIQQEYRRRVAEWKGKNNTETPPLEQIQPEIETMLRQRLVDASLDRWLGEVRTQTQITYSEGYKL